MANLAMLMQAEAEPLAIAAVAAADPALLDEMLRAISPDNKDDRVRHTSHLALLELCRLHPDVLLPYWDYLVSLLRSHHAFARMNGLYLVAALVAVETTGRLDAAFDTYLDLLADEKVSVAAHAAANAGKIAQARPDLRSHITERLLRIDQSPLPTERVDLIKGSVIEAFDAYFTDLPDPAPVAAFVRAQLSASSPKTRKAAKGFLSRHHL